LLSAERAELLNDYNNLGDARALANLLISLDNTGAKSFPQCGKKSKIILPLGVAI